MSEQLQQLLNFLESEIKNRSDNVDTCLDEIKTQLKKGNYKEIVTISITVVQETGYSSALEMCAHRLRKIIAQRGIRAHVAPT